MGGDDFLTKPYDNKVLVARILANVRRVQMDAAEPSLRGYTCPAFRLDADNRSVHCRGEDIHLADMEYRILSLFVRNPNTFFTANELYQKIWGKDSLGDVRTVQVHIHNLRSKIEPDPAKPVYLCNVWGKGYVFARKANRSKQNNSAAEHFCGLFPSIHKVCLSTRRGVPVRARAPQPAGACPRGSPDRPDQTAQQHLGGGNVGGNGHAVHSHRRSRFCSFRLEASTLSGSRKNSTRSTSSQATREVICCTPPSLPER